MFLLTSKFYPQGVVSPCPRAIYMYNIMKNLYKIRFQRDFLKLVANDRSDKRFLLTSKLCPLGLSAPGLQLINHKKMCIKSEVEEIILSFMSTKGQGHLLTCPNHSDSIFLNVFSSITAYFNISSALRCAIQDQWPSGFTSHRATRCPERAPCIKQTFGPPNFAGKSKCSNRMTFIENV